MQPVVFLLLSNLSCTRCDSDQGQAHSEKKKASLLYMHCICILWARLQSRAHDWQCNPSTVEAGLRLLLLLLL